MNLYVVDAGPYEYRETIDPELGGPWCDGYAIELIEAETRGKAKAAFVRQFGHRFEFTEPMKIRLLAHDFHGDKWEANDYWMNAEAALHPDTFDDVRWQGYLDDDNNQRDPFAAAPRPERADDGTERER